MNAHSTESVRACPHGFPSAKSCIDCMYDDGVGGVPVEPVTVEARFTARYEGDCHACNLPISVGQPIAKLSTGRYVHGGCVNG